MFVPSLNLDGSVNKKRSTMKERDGAQPGTYSPRPSANSSTVTSSVDSTGKRHLDPLLTTSGTSAATDTTHDDFGNSSFKDDGQSLSSSQRRPDAIETLLEHNQARESSPSVPRLSGDTLGNSYRERSTSHNPNAATAGGVLGVKYCTLPSTIDKFTFREAYVSGVPFKKYLSTRSDVHPTSKGTTFRQNPIEYVSAMATCNEYVATGDRAGRVSIMRREPITPSQRKTMLSDITRAPPRTTVPYEYHVSQFAYSSVIDPLNNVEVTPNIAALAFLPHTSPSPLLLTANEKVPKLYKVLPSVRKSVDPVRMVDQLEADGTGPLTSPSRDSTVAMKMISRFALNHEYSINSLCPLTDSEQFVSADDLTVQLWCTEYPEISLETYNIRPPGDEDPKEIIRTVKNFPHEPFLLFVVTSAGNVRVIDMRQNLKWFSQSGSLFSNPSRDADGTFGHVTNSLSDCALSPCGRYIAGRDFMTVCLWDVRGATGGAPSMSPSSPIHRKDTTGTNTVTPLRQWELHPHLRQDMEKFYQSDLLFERFDLVFMNRNSVCTGGFNSSLYLIDMDKVAGSPNDVQQVQLPALDGCTSVAKQSLKIKSSSANNNTESSKTEIGSRVTLLSSPVASYGGNCEIMASCGQAVTQLNYVAA